MSTDNESSEPSANMLEPSLLAKKARLQDRLEKLGSAVVAYSGGVDSSILAFYSRIALGDKAIIAIAVSASLAESDLLFARSQAENFSWDLVEVATSETDLPAYMRNDHMRCFYCKATLFEKLLHISHRLNASSIIYGANLDDADDFRPGELAAAQFKVESPLRDCDLSKHEIRLLAAHAGLPSWDRPQNACLASRVARNIPVTEITLKQVEKAEAFIRDLGFHQVRVRHLGESASVEVGADELHRLKVELDLTAKIEEFLVALGYDNIRIDPRGYSTGGAGAGFI